MSIQRVRHCQKCNTHRIGGCSPTCAADDPTVTDNWRDQPTTLAPCPIKRGADTTGCPFASDPRQLCSHAYTKDALNQAKEAWT